jgi:glycosyltransferase involved in cell wall biosynthesis
MVKVMQNLCSIDFAMKILIISFTYPPNKDGVSEAASAMAQGLLEHGYRVEVLTESLEQRRSKIDDAGIFIHEFTYSSGNNHEIVICDDGGSYAEFLRSGNWDVIFVHGYFETLSQAMPVLDQIHARKVLVSHGYSGLIWDRMPNFPFGIPSLIRRFLRSLMMFYWIHCFDRVVYLSETADFQGFYDHWIASRCGYSGRRVIPNGVSLNVYGEAPDEFRRLHGIPADAFLLVSVANYSMRKDQGYSARAFRKAAIPGSVLVFIGSQFNESSDRFQEEDKPHAEEHSPGTVIWLEKQSRALTLDALAASDVCVLSASHEAQPIVLLESMRESKPWVARSAGCIASLEGGICVRSEREMADAFTLLYADTQLRDRLGREGRKAVESKYHRDAYVEAYVDLLREMTS